MSQRPPSSTAMGGSAAGEPSRLGVGVAAYGRRASCRRSPPREGLQLASDALRSRDSPRELLQRSNDANHTVNDAVLAIVVAKDKPISATTGAAVASPTSAAALHPSPPPTMAPYRAPMDRSMEKEEGHQFHRRHWCTFCRCG